MAKKNTSNRRPNQDFENDFDKYSKPERSRNSSSSSNPTFNEDAQVNSRKGDRSQMGRSHTSR